MKKICFITTSRADFGTINELIKVMIKNKKIKVNLIVSGNHGNKTFGSTVKEIKKHKNYGIIGTKIFCNNKNPVDVTKSFSESVKKISKILSNLRPDIFVVFGDRYEMLAATIAAYILRINIVHIAGGENIDNYYVGSIVEDITLAQASGVYANCSFTANIIKYDGVTRVATPPPTTQ